VVGRERVGEALVHRPERLDAHAEVRSVQRTLDRRAGRHAPDGAREHERERPRGPRRPVVHQRGELLDEAGHECELADALGIADEVEGLQQARVAGLHGLEQGYGGFGVGVAQQEHRRAEEGTEILVRDHESMTQRETQEASALQGVGVHRDHQDAHRLGLAQQRERRGGLLVGLGDRPRAGDARGKEARVVHRFGPRVRGGRRPRIRAGRVGLLDSPCVLQREIPVELVVVGHDGGQVSAKQGDVARSAH